jgi:hypothetical protein
VSLLGEHNGPIPALLQRPALLMMNASKGDLPPFQAVLRSTMQRTYAQKASSAAVMAAAVSVREMRDLPEAARLRAHVRRMTLLTNDHTKRAEDRCPHEIRTNVGFS